MTKERDKELLEAFYKESGIHHAISQNTYRNFVERFLATPPEEKEEKPLCDQCGKPAELLYCEKCYDRNSL